MRTFPLYQVRNPEGELLGLMSCHLEQRVLRTGYVRFRGPGPSYARLVTTSDHLDYELITMQAQLWAVYRPEQKPMQEPEYFYVLVTDLPLDVLKTLRFFR